MLVNIDDLSTNTLGRISLGYTLRGGQRAGDTPNDSQTGGYTGAWHENCREKYIYFDIRGGILGYDKC